MQRARTPERGITHEARGAGGLSVKDLYENTKKLLPMLLFATGMAKSAEAADMPPSAKAAEAQLSQRPSAVEVAKGWVKDSPLILDTSSGSAAVRFAPEGVRITPTFFEKQPGGEVNFNAWSILAPVQLEVPWTQRIPQRSSTEMPYEYARLFAPDPKSGEPQRRSDQEKIVSYIGQQLKQDFAGTLHGLDMSKNVYRQQHQIEEAQAKPGDSIEIIRLVGFGFASPEGPAQKGTGTLEHGEIDQENIDLARVRGIQALGATKKALERQGVDTSTLGKAAQEARAAERQFSFAEVRTLAKLAQEFSGTDTREKVFEMTKAYNDGVISPEVGKQLDAIFATKRAARVVVDYEGDKKDTYLIPLPLVLLLLPALPRLSRRRKEQPKPPHPKELKGLPEKPRGLREKPSKPEKSSIPDTIRNAPFPPVGTPEYENMRERVMLDDIDLFFNHDSTVRGGLDYQKLTEEARVQLRGVPVSQHKEIELVLTEKILKAWERHDRDLLRKAGISRDVAYQNSPDQIAWARMHAQVLVDLAIKKSEYPSQEYRPLIDGMSLPFKRRRATRYRANRPREISQRGKPGVE